MGKIREILISRFDGGISNDKRSKNLSKFAMSRHFDTHTYAHKLVPKFGADSKETGDDWTAASVKPFKFIYDEINGARRLIALCKTSNSYALLLYWDNDASIWINPTGGISVSDEVVDDVFFSYKGYAYFWAGTTKLQRYKLTADSGLDESYQTVTAFTKRSELGTSDVCQPIHHSNEIAYFFTGNLVHKLDDTVWSANALTLPSGSVIWATSEYQDYIVIGVNYTGFIKSTIFFWNKDSGLNTISYKYEMENRKIYNIEVVNGRLMVISTDYTKIYIDRYNGAEFETINELVIDRLSALATSISLLNKENIIVDNKLLFPMDYIARGTAYNSRLGIWSLDSNGKLVLAYKVDGATTYKGIFYLQGNLWIAYNAGSVVRSSITFSTDVTSDYETLFIGNIEQNKKLLSVGVSTEPMPNAGQIVLKYRLDEEDDWTTIFTHTTNGSYYHEAINIESTGATLTEFREIQFKIESIGGAIVIELKIKYEEKDDNLN